MNSTRAMTGVEIAVVLAVLAGITWLAKPSLFPGHSRRAEQSTEATARLEAATSAQGGTAAASVAKIGEANAAAPESPSRAFIAAEVPLTLSLLPAPDPTALIEAERRKSAVMEGRLDEARRLYDSAAAKADRLQRERDEALAARQAADLALEKAAAAEHARTMQAIGIGALALLLGAGWLYVKFNGISPSVAGKIIADYRAGTPITTAFDTYLSPRIQNLVNREAKLATTLPPEPSKP